MKTRRRGMTMAELPRDYAGLVALFLPRPLHDAVDLRNATEFVDLMAGHDLSRDQEDYLDLLSDLVDKYESLHTPLARKRLTPVDALRFLIEENGLSASDLGRLLGDRALGPKVLSGERELSKEHIRKLSARFCVNPRLFLGE